MSSTLETVIHLSVADGCAGRAWRATSSKEPASEFDRSSCHESKRVDWGQAVLNNVHWPQKRGVQRDLPNHSQRQLEATASHRRIRRVGVPSFGPTSAIHAQEEHERGFSKYTATEWWSSKESFNSLKEHQRTEVEESERQLGNACQHMAPFSAIKLRYPRFQKERERKKADKYCLGEEDNDLLKGLRQLGQRLQGKAGEIKNPLDSGLSIPAR